MCIGVSRDKVNSGSSGYRYICQPVKPRSNWECHNWAYPTSVKREKFKTKVFINESFTFLYSVSKYLMTHKCL